MRRVKAVRLKTYNIINAHPENKKKRRKIWSAFFLFGFMNSIAGCGTLVERSPSSKTYKNSGHYYVGTQYDLKLLLLEKSTDDDSIPFLCYLSIICPLATLISIPLDFIIDSTMLYGDHRNKLVEEEKLNDYLRVKYCPLLSKPDELDLKQLGLELDFCKKEDEA